MKYRVLMLSVLTSFWFTSNAGNKDRLGQAGATQLTINPWAHSTGMAGANSASARGLEATAYNISGLAFVPKTEIIYSNVQWLGSGAEGVSMNSAGIAQRVGQASVIGISLSTFGFGDIDVTTYNQPEGGLGTFNINNSSIRLSYAREFSNSIYGGFTFKTVSEGISNVNASAVAFDAGIRYVTGKQENLQFGIAINNIGPRMKFSGDGLNETIELDDKEFTLAVNAESFELPASLNIGLSYDVYLGEEMEEDDNGLYAPHRLTGHFTFYSNSFGKDQYLFGAEYAFIERFMVRGGYTVEDNSGDEVSTSAFTGLSAGASIEWPFGANSNKVALDYSYRATEHFDAVHSIALRLNL